jgi:methylase of polypeptide subunit release factors
MTTILRRLEMRAARTILHRLVRNETDLSLVAKYADNLLAQLRPGAPATGAPSAHRAIDPAALVYHYGTDKNNVAYIVTSADDASAVRKCIDLLAPGKPRGVICHDKSLQSAFADTGVNLVDYGDIAAKEIPIVVLPSAEAEQEVVRRCHELWKETRAKFAIFDAYQPSEICTQPVVRPYRQVTLHLEPSTLFPTIYSNWDYINILLEEIGRRPLDVLDMFAGSGVIGFSLRKEAPLRSISFAEVNYWAVRSMRKTMANDPELSGNIWLSEGMTGVPPSQTFDLIVGNPPHANLKLDGPRTLPGADPAWEAHHIFFRDAWKHLKPGGRILFIESRSAEILEGFYSGLSKQYPQYKLSRVIDQPNHVCFVVEILLA